FGIQATATRVNSTGCLSLGGAFRAILVTHVWKPGHVSGFHFPRVNFSLGNPCQVRRVENENVTGCPFPHGAPRYISDLSMPKMREKNEPMSIRQINPDPRPIDCVRRRPEANAVFRDLVPLD